jgi:hypothetical protein
MSREFTREIRVPDGLASTAAEYGYNQYTTIAVYRRREKFNMERNDERNDQID